MKLLRSIPMWAGLLLSLGAGAAEGPPGITVQPTDSAVREGEMLILRISTDGSQPLAFQWLRDSAAIADATGDSYLVGPVLPDDDSVEFSVIVSNALGETTSSNAVLTVEAGIIVAASANQAKDLVLYRGWPLVLEVALIHPDAFDSNAVPILISGTNGPWFNALQVDVRNSLDQPQTWSFHAAPFTNQTIQLTSESGGRMLCWLTPAETAPLPG